MPKAETVRVVNTKNRNYNGICKDQTVDIHVNDLPGYIAAGFNLIGEVVEDLVDLTIAVVKLDRAGIVRELKELGVDFKEVGVKTEKLSSLLQETKAAKESEAAAAASAAAATSAPEDAEPTTQTESELADAEGEEIDNEVAEGEEGEDAEGEEIEDEAPEAEGTINPPGAE